MREAHIGVRFVQKSFLLKDEADEHFSEAHSEERTNVME